MVAAVNSDEVVDTAEGADAVIEGERGIDVYVDNRERPQGGTTMKRDGVNPSVHDDVVLDFQELVDEILAQYYPNSSCSSAYARRPKRSEFSTQ